MKIPEIKRLAETYSLNDLKQAEQDLLEERDLKIQVEGADEGEKLTHILASIWIKEDMEKNGCDVRASLRNYSVKVRTSIS